MGDGVMNVHVEVNRQMTDLGVPAIFTSRRDVSAEATGRPMTATLSLAPSMLYWLAWLAWVRWWRYQCPPPPRVARYAHAQPARITTSLLHEGPESL